MSAPAVEIHSDFVLPASVVSKIDVSRLVNEVERIDGEITAATVRAKIGAQEYPTPVFSEQLTNFLDENKIELGDSKQRMVLVKELRLLKDSAPVIHMTFAVTADFESLRQLAGWVRESIHPQAIISVGLQPALVAGVYLRTPNRVHDLSMRSALKGKRAVLLQELETLRGSK